jgi:WD40 repeat protein
LPSFETHVLAEHLTYIDNHIIAMFPGGTGHRGRLTLWDARRGEQEASSLPLPNCLEYETCSLLAALPNKSLVAITDEHDVRIRLWNTRTNAATVLAVGHEGRIAGLAASPDGRMLASAGGTDKTVILWEPDRRESIGSVAVDSPYTDVLGLAFNPADGLSVLAYTDSLHHRRASLRTFSRNVNSEQVFDLPEALAREGDSAGRLIFSPDLSVAVGFRYGTVALWDWRRGTRLARLDTQAIGDVVESVAFSPDGRLLVTGGRRGGIALWSVPDLRRIATIGRASGPVVEVTFSGDGRKLATEVDAGPPTVSLWDVASEEDMRPLPSDAASGSVSLALDQRGERLAVANSEGTIAVWDTARTEQLGQLLVGHSGPISAMAFSPDGDILVSAEDGNFPEGQSRLFLWDARYYRQLVSLAPKRLLSVAYVSFSHDGSQVAIGGQGPVVRTRIGIAAWRSGACAIVGALTRPGSAPSSSLDLTGVC